MIDIYAMKPVNKTAASVTSQGNVTNDFLLADRESLKILGERKKYFMDAIVELKKEIGIDAREGSGANTKYPKKILRHPKYKQFRSLRESLTNLDKEIFNIRQRIKKNAVQVSMGDFFISEIKKINLELYLEIKEKYFNLEK